MHKYCVTLCAVVAILHDLATSRTWKNLSILVCSESLRTHTNESSDLEDGLSVTVTYTRDCQERRRLAWTWFSARGMSWSAWRYYRKYRLRGSRCRYDTLRWTATQWFLDSWDSLYGCQTRDRSQGSFPSVVEFLCHQRGIVISITRREDNRIGGNLLEMIFAI